MQAFSAWRVFNLTTMNVQNRDIHDLTETLIFELTKAFALPQTERREDIGSV
jgi:hypothetical protein